MIMAPKAPTKRSTAIHGKIFGQAGLLFLFLLFCDASFSGAQEAYVRWDLAANQHVSAVVGPILGFEQTMSDMVVYKYELISGSETKSQTLLIKDGLWPKESTQNGSRYIQFKVRPKPGIVFQIDSLSMYYTGKGGSNMRINIAFSTDSNFVASKQLNPAKTPVTISSEYGHLEQLKYRVNASITSAEVFYVRIFPWYALNLYNKLVCLQNVIISGTTSGAIIPSLASVATLPITDISTKTAVCGGNVLSDGDGIISSRGVCWSKNKFPTIDDSHTTDGAGAGAYASQLSGLEANTKYYIRAYVTNTAGTGYGEQDSLVTLQALAMPSVRTEEDVTVIGTSAIIEATVVHWGGSPVVERGFCYNTTGHPTVNDRTAIEGSGTGPFKHVVFYLSGNTKYFIRAYAKNDLGIGYGEEREFTVSSPLPGTFADGVHKDTKAIQAAIDSCSAAGGGTVLFAHGHYLSAPFEVKSNVRIQIDSSAILFASKDIKDYYRTGADTTLTSLRPFISSDRAQNITFTGKGKIDGNGQVWWPDAIKYGAAGKSYPRPVLIMFARTQDILFENITLLNSPMWNVLPYYCSRVTIRNVTMHSPPNSPNTDGINPSMSHDVLIANCTIDVGDDNVAIKAENIDSVYADAGCSDIRVTDCTFLQGHGVSIGSATVGGVKNVTVEQCTFKYTDNGIRIKSDRDRGGNVREIAFRNISMDSVKYTILFSGYYPNIPDQADSARPIISTTPYVHDILVENLTSTNTKYAGLIIGRPEKFIDNVLLRNVTISSNSGLTVRNATVEFIDSKIAAASGVPIIYQKNGVVTDITENSDQELPQAFSLSQNYPNPFNSETVIRYHVPVPSHVSLKVYDVVGQEIITLVDMLQQQGMHYSKFSTQHLPLSSGVYLYRIKAGNFIQAKKIILIK